MAKLILDDLVNLQNEQSAVGTINSNSAAIEAALENTLSRDGTSPNQMLADLDMNSNSILNLPAPTTNTEPLRLGDLPDILPTILVADDAPVTSYTENSLWIDSDSADYDLYQLQSNSWVDTGVNLEGVQGDPGLSPDVYVQDSAPVTTGLEGSLWIDSDSTDYDLYQLQSASWVDTGVNLKGIQGIQGVQGPQGDPWDQWQGAWQTATAYVENDAVENDGSSYLCTADHTSGATTEPGTGVDWATVWDLLASKGADGLGTGDVTAANAFGTDNRIIRSDGADKGVQSSGVTLDDSDNLSGVNNVTGSDTDFVTGTAGTNGTLAQWNADGDVVQGPSATAPQFSSIELSHASDNTLTANSGTLLIEGVVNPSFTNTAWAAASESSGDVTLDVADGAQLTFTRTMAGAEELQVPSNMPDGATIYLAVAAGVNTLTFAAGYEGAGDALPDCEGDCLLTIVRHGSRYYVSALVDLGDGV